VAAVFGSVRSAGVGFRYYYLRKRFIAIGKRSWDFDFAYYLNVKFGKVRLEFRVETVLKDIGPLACTEQWACSKLRSPCLTSVSVEGLTFSFRNDEPFWLYRFSRRWWRSRCSLGL
jgi:hypothetical protein